MCFILMFPAWSSVSINDVNKLVSSISSALDYLVRKLQWKNFRAIADVI